MKNRRVRRLSRLHRLVFRVTGGKVGKRLVGNDILLLTTTGWKTGRSHTVPLLFLDDGDSTVVIASYGGRDYHPAWYLNLVAHPEVKVMTPHGRFRAIARTATEAERSVWWPRIVEAYQGYAGYQSRTDRLIPVVLLEPTGAG